MSGWHWDHPGIGDMEVIRGFAAHISARSTELQELTADVRSAASQGTGASVFTGNAATAWAERAPGLQESLGTIVEVLEARYRAAQVYVSEVENIRYAADVVWEERGAALRGLAAWEQASPDYQMSLTGSIRRGELDMRTYETRRSLERLSDQRAAADNAFAAALHAEVAVNGWGSSAIMGIVGGFPPYGAPSIEDIERAEALEAAARISSEDAGLTWEEDWRFIDDYLKAHADDPEALSSFYRALGGDGVAKLTYMSVLMDNGSDFALRIQSTFAAASYEWTDAQAGSMADDLVAACIADGGSVAVLGFLLHGGASKGEDYPLVSSTAAKAFATAVYEVEIGADGDHPLWTMDSMSDAFYGWYIDNVLTPEGDYSVTGSPMAGLYDSTGDVVLTLAAYPDDALAWVYDGGNVDHTEWMFTRDWADGYEAPTYLLRQIQDATDGVSDSGFMGNSRTVYQTLDVTGRAMTYLTLGDDAISPGMLSGAASNTFADSLGRLSPYLAESFILDLDGSGGPSDAHVWTIRDGVGQEELYFVPNVTQGVYVQAVRLFSDSPDAMLTFDTHVAVYNARILDAMGEGAGLAYPADDGMKRLAWMSALTDEVEATRTIQHLEDTAHTQGTVVDAGAFVAGKGASAIVTGVTDGAGAAVAPYVGTAVKAGVSSVGHGWVDDRLNQAIDERIAGVFTDKADFGEALQRAASAQSPWVNYNANGPSAPISSDGDFLGARQEYEVARDFVKERMETGYAGKLQDGETGK